MKVMVFDTETIGLEKSFCYNIGFTIFDTETGLTEVSEDFVVEQIWNNKPLFETAYYANKKDIYISRMRGGKAKLTKFGYITQHMAHLIKLYDIKYAYAFNSPFDDKVFRFNCDWFHCINPFDNVKIIDIRGLVHKFIAFTPRFQEFCDNNGFYTETGNYSTTAETVYRFINNTISFNEEHTALADSCIEQKILTYCIGKGGEYGTVYKVYRTVPCKKMKIVKVIKTKDMQEVYRTEGQKIRVIKDNYSVNMYVD